MEVLLGRPTNHPHVDVGMFEVYAGSKDDGTGRSTEDMIGSLRIHAALRGCDAVQILDVEAGSRHTWHVVRGACEIYTDAPATSATTPIPDQRYPTEGEACVIGDNGAPVCQDPMICRLARCGSPYAP